MPGIELHNIADCVQEVNSCDIASRTTGRVCHSNNDVLCKQVTLQRRIKIIGCVEKSGGTTVNDVSDRGTVRYSNEWTIAGYFRGTKVKE